MAKTKAVYRSSKNGRFVYRSAGKTSDGISVLRPKASPKHFSNNDIRKAVTTVSGERKLLKG